MRDDDEPTWCHNPITYRRLLPWPQRWRVSCTECEGCRRHFLSTTGRPKGLAKLYDAKGRFVRAWEVEVAEDGTMAVIDVLGAGESIELIFPAPDGEAGP